MSEKKPLIDIKKLNLNSKALAIMFGVPLLAFFGYVQFSANSTNEDEANKVSIGTPDLNLNDTNKTASNKSDIYEKERREQRQKSRLKKPNFYSFDEKEEEEIEEIVVVEKEVQPRIIYRERKPKKVEPVIEEPEVKVRKKTSFYSNSANGNATSSNTGNLIPAIIHGKQVITNNQPVKLRTTVQSVIGGKIVPANTYITGMASFTNERVKIKISSLKLGNNYITQSISVIDNDGVSGINIPGGIEQKVAQDGLLGANNLSGGITVDIPVIGSLSTGALKKKIDVAEVTLPSGYTVSLKIK